MLFKGKLEAKTKEVLAFIEGILEYYVPVSGRFSLKT
jgi:hypothetical protein